MGEKSEWLRRGQFAEIIPVELKTISNWAFATRVVIWVGILVAGGILAAGYAPLTIVLGIVILGVGFAHSVELCHQALHNAEFTHPRLNEIIGVVLGSGFIRKR